MTTGKARTGTIILPWLFVAVVLHANVAAIAFVIHRLFPSTPATPRAEPLDVSLVDEGQLSPEERAALARDTSLSLAPPATDPRTEAQRRAEEEQKRQEDSVRPTGQVVEIPQPVEEKVPTKASYVSEYNSSVEKQTVHRGRPGEPEGARPSPGEKASRGQPRPPAEAPPPPTPPPTPSVKPGGPPTPRLAMRPAGPEPAKAPDRRAGAPAEAPDGLQPRTPRPRGAGLPGGGGGPPTPDEGGARRPLTMADLMPSDEALSRAIGRGGSVDAVRDAEEGEFTALNTRRWKYASFFNRVKRAVADHWHPDRAYRRRDPQGNVYGFKDRLTVLRVELNSQGALKDVYVEHPSGVDFLDDEAVKAFKEAQPFPNPPRQLVNESGQISFRFGFLFELSSTPTFRMFRYNY